MSNKGEIYIIKNTLNNKVYIGQTVSKLSSGRKYGFKKRWKKHVNDSKRNKNDSICLANAIRKYGDNIFNIELLLKCNINHLDYYETNFIILYNSISPNGYNIETGGNKNKKLHQNTKIKISKKHRFLNVSLIDKQKILSSMKEINITEIPYGINYTHHIKNNYGDKTKNIISDYHTLTEKLKLSLQYYDYILSNNNIELEKLEFYLNKCSLISLRNKKLSVKAKEYIYEAGYKINDIPINIRYEKRNNRFFININGKNKYFTKNEPIKSLNECINYDLQQRELV